MILLIRFRVLSRALTSIDFTALNSSIRLIDSSSSLNKRNHDRSVFGHLILFTWAFLLFNIFVFSLVKFPLRGKVKNFRQRFSTFPNTFMQYVWLSLCLCSHILQVYHFHILCLIYQIFRQYYTLIPLLLFR